MDLACTRRTEWNHKQHCMTSPLPTYQTYPCPGITVSLPGRLRCCSGPVPEPYSFDLRMYCYYNILYTYESHRNTFFKQLFILQTEYEKMHFFYFTVFSHEFQVWGGNFRFGEGNLFCFCLPVKNKLVNICSKIAVMLFFHAHNFHQLSSKNVLLCFEYL